MGIYEKPAMSPAEHIEQWRARGLLIEDENSAERYLSHISYYRLSGYAIPFYQSGISRHQFKTNSTFSDIVKLYSFDRELRVLVMDAIERVEVAVRAQLCNHMSTTYDKNPFWYLDEQHFKREFAHKRLLADLERQLDEERKRLERDEQQLEKRKNLTAEKKAEIKQSLRKENFIRHYLSNYDKPRLPPCWMMVEMLTWGQISHLYAGLDKSSDQKAMARNLGTHAELLISWLRGLNMVRNICAHHARLWNRELGVNIQLPKSDQVRWLANEVKLTDLNVNYAKRCYPVLVALQSLLYTISPASTWAQRLKELLERYPTISLAHMGMPIDWYEDPFWQEALTVQSRAINEPK